MTSILVSHPVPLADLTAYGCGYADCTEPVTHIFASHSVVVMCATHAEQWTAAAIAEAER